MIPIHGFFPYFISLFPGFGHLLVKRNTKAVAYGIPFWGIVLLFFYTFIGHGSRDFGAFLFFTDIVLWVICYIDMIFTLQKLKSAYAYAQMQQQNYDYDASAYDPMHRPFPPLSKPPFPPNPGEIPMMSSNPTVYDPDRSTVLMLSFIPGLAHLHLGLMQRGLSTMLLFFGVAIFIFFVTGMTSNGSFLAFLLALPVLWFYSMYDALHLHKRKMKGELLEDRSFFDDLYSSRTAGKRNRTVATLLSIFPGAGHLYLGMQKRGMQLMVGFLLSLYLLDVIRLSFFLLLIPIFWFFSFFDALQIISRFEREETYDEPVVNGLKNYQRWIGLGMLLIGIYYVFDQVGPRILNQFFNESGMQYYFMIRDYFHIIVVSCILIIGGIVLLVRRKKYY